MRRWSSVFAYEELEQMEPQKPTPLAPAPPFVQGGERSPKDALIHAYVAVYIFIKKTLYCVEAAGHSQVVGVFFHSVSVFVLPKFDRIYFSFHSIFPLPNMDTWHDCIGSRN